MSQKPALWGSRNAKKTRCVALVADRGHYKEVKVMTQVSLETRKEGREGCPGEQELLNHIPREEDREAGKEAEKEELPGDRAQK